ncbi:MAG: glycosyl hydrolase 108 family protein [Halobacteriota archaeon]|nr:glycosyl hydrolase 108 family protein [Halobacteriota archaeon]
MAEFDKSFARTLVLEGGYSDDPNDPGGKTRYGITEYDARQHGYDGEMKDLPVEIAKKIYRERYWDPIKGEEIGNQMIADEVFDTAVNCGVKTAGRFLQRSLNALFLYKGNEMYRKLVVDGVIGPKTLKALDKYLDKRGYEALLKTLNCLQGNYYVILTESDRRGKKFATFFYGWITNRVDCGDKEGR